jgi:hypothetical protein
MKMEGSVKGVLRVLSYVGRTDDERLPDARMNA